jgi:hypothetical protein
MQSRPEESSLYDLYELIGKKEGGVVSISDNGHVCLDGKDPGGNTLSVDLLKNGARDIKIIIIKPLTINQINFIGKLLTNLENITKLTFVAKANLPQEQIQYILTAMRGVEHSLQEFVFNVLEKANCEVAELAKLLRQYNRLKSFTITGCKSLQNQEAAAIANIVAANAILEELILSDCGICEEGALHLASMLKINKSLKRLDLSGNQIQDKGAEYIANALINNKNLYSLKLANCAIQNPGLAWIAHLIKLNKYITLIDLRATVIDEVRANILAEALWWNHTICTIAFDDCPHLTKEHITDMLQNNQNEASRNIEVFKSTRHVPVKISLAITIRRLGNTTKSSNHALASDMHDELYDRMMPHITTCVEEYTGMDLRIARNKVITRRIGKFLCGVNLVEVVLDRYRLDLRGVESFLNSVASKKRGYAEELLFQHFIEPQTGIELRREKVCSFVEEMFSLGIFAPQHMVNLACLSSQLFRVLEYAYNSSGLNAEIHGSEELFFRGRLYSNPERSICCLQ